MKVWATYHTVLNDAESGARSNLVAADGSDPEVGGDNIGSVFPSNLLLCCCNTLLRAGYVLCVFTSRSMHNHTLTHLRVNGTFFLRILVSFFDPQVASSAVHFQPSSEWV